MKTPVPPFHNANDELLYALLTGGNCLAYEQLSIDNTDTTILLNAPSGTIYAMIVIEADPTTTDKTRIARFLESPETGNPTSDTGIPLGDLSVYEVKGRQNLDNFRIIGIEAGKTHSLKIQYFG